MKLTVLNRFVCRFPWVTIALFVAATAVFAVYMPNLDIDPDVGLMEVSTQLDRDRLTTQLTEALPKITKQNRL